MFDLCVCIEVPSLIFQGQPGLPGDQGPLGDPGPWGSPVSKVFKLSHGSFTLVAPLFLHIFYEQGNPGRSGLPGAKVMLVISLPLFHLWENLQQFLLSRGMLWTCATPFPIVDKIVFSKRGLAHKSGSVNTSMEK